MNLFFWQNQNFGAKRDKGWRQFRKEYFKNNPYCAISGKKGNIFKPLTLHHIKPFYLFPELELDPDNVIGMRGEYHLLFGHLNYWKSWNKNVVEDCKYFNIKIFQRP